MVRKAGLVVLALAALGLAAWSWLGVSGARGLAVLGAPAQARSPEPALPRIALDRLKQQEAPPEASGPQRDLFQFGRPPAPPETPRPIPVTTLPVMPVDAGPPTPPAAPTLPPFGVKFVGSVEQKGTKVAILLSDDKKEVLTGREGDTVANRLRIVKIGLESVEVQDVGSERVRRIPLKGN
jgi:hypothetical protein